MNLIKIFGGKKREKNNTHLTKSVLSSQGSLSFTYSKMKILPVHASLLQLSEGDAIMETTPASNVTRPTKSETSNESNKSKSNTEESSERSKIHDAETEETVLRAWGQSQKYKMLPIPTDYPDYMRDAPKLNYSETHTSLLRRKYNSSKIKSYSYRPIKKNEKLLRTGPKPKENKTSFLRKTFIRKKPIISNHFEKHYSTYNKPPFKNTNLKLHD